MTDGRGTAQGRGGPAGTGEPDWAAMADRHEHEVRRRRQLQIVGGVVAATLVVGGITATAVGLSGSDRTGGAPAAAGGGPTATEPTGVVASAAPSTSAPASSSPSAPGGPSARPSTSPSGARPSAAPADPLTVISSAATDTAPLDPAALFPASATAGGRTWTRLTTATTDPCWKATTGGLGDVLAAHGCRSILRATYTDGSGAVTVGIAVLDSKTQADAVAAGHKGQVQGLVPAGSTSYCTGPGCANTHAAVGRYGYYTVAGTVKPGGTAQDPVATAAQADFAARARAALLARGHR
ncbi:hypothetical protein [Kitasatospora sp. DSM 101779]|uniref:hypothetical protein n=1 Tax=Kitasatospora sp. DSM 101779 TaxID=2853165 RepID=UPI0021DB50F9|nr:hypothetical protein [Kitasatospora sp. DSM 101779]MCU7821932.1 hypothetical protein [Kitasatospora sp. DSM 101779]